jgi:hypothetical protein
LEVVGRILPIVPLQDVGGVRGVGGGVDVHRDDFKMLAERSADGPGTRKELQQPHFEVSGEQVTRPTKLFFRSL